MTSYASKTGAPRVHGPLPANATGGGHSSDARLGTANVYGRDDVMRQARTAKEVQA